MIILGIDPGLSGALAILNGERDQPPELIEAIDVPVNGVDAKKRVDVMAVLRWLHKHQPKAAFIERAQAMPDQGSSSGFIYGRAVGHLEACAMGFGAQVHFIKASMWKKRFGLKGGGTAAKEMSRQRAIQLWPTSPAFELKGTGRQRAEAALIGKFGWETVRL